jgi:hypothetical protein
VRSQVLVVSARPLRLSRFAVSGSPSSRCADPKINARHRARGPDGATRHARSALVVSHHLDGFLRAAAAGLLRPAADPEVRRVPSRFTRVDPKASRGCALGPRDATDPSKGFPRQEPCRVTATASPLPFPLMPALHRMVPRCARTSTSRPCSPDESVSSTLVAKDGALVPPMGLALLEAAPHRRFPKVPHRSAAQESHHLVHPTPKGHMVSRPRVFRASPDRRRRGDLSPASTPTPEGAAVVALSVGPRVQEAAGSDPPRRVRRSSRGLPGRSPRRGGRTTWAVRGATGDAEAGPKTMPLRRSRLAVRRERRTGFDFRA